MRGTGGGGLGVGAMGVASAAVTVLRSDMRSAHARCSLGSRICIRLSTNVQSMGLYEVLRRYVVDGLEIIN